MISDLVVEGLSWLAGGAIGHFVVEGIAKMVSKPNPAPVEPRCTGYASGRRNPTTGKFAEPTLRSDCEALRSVSCLDGRCSFHCQSMCKCDEPKFR